MIHRLENTFINEYKQILNKYSALKLYNTLNKEFGTDYKVGPVFWIIFAILLGSTLLFTITIHDTDRNMIVEKILFSVLGYVVAMSSLYLLIYFTIKIFALKDLSKFYHSLTNEDLQNIAKELRDYHKLSDCTQYFENLKGFAEEYLQIIPFKRAMSLMSDNEQVKPYVMKYIFSNDSSSFNAHLQGLYEDLKDTVCRKEKTQKNKELANLVESL